MSEPDEDFGDLNDVVFDFNEEGDLVATNAIAGVDDDDDGEAPVRAGVVVPQTTAARKFMREHKWVDDFQNHAEANEDLIRQSATLVHDGYSPDDPAYYSELERRMARKHHKTIVTRGGSETLSREDVAVMRQFKLDPQNVEHVRAFVRERRALRNQEF